MTDAEIMDAIMNASDKSESIEFNGNMMTSLEISSVTVGKKATFYYDPDGGTRLSVISDI